MNRVKKSGMICLKIGGCAAGIWGEGELGWSYVMNRVLSELHSAMLTVIRIRRALCSGHVLSVVKGLCASY